MTILAESSTITKNQRAALLSFDEIIKVADVDVALENVELVLCETPVDWQWIDLDAIDKMLVAPKYAGGYEWLVIIDEHARPLSISRDIYHDLRRLAGLVWSDYLNAYIRRPHCYACATQRYSCDCEVS